MNPLKKLKNLHFCSHCIINVRKFYISFLCFIKTCLIKLQSKISQINFPTKWRLKELELKLGERKWEIFGDEYNVFNRSQRSCYFRFDEKSRRTFECLILTLKVFVGNVPILTGIFYVFFVLFAEKFLWGVSEMVFVARFICSKFISLIFV